MSLKGLHVLVTRPFHQAQSLSEAILKRGGEVTLFPTLEIKPVFNKETLTKKLVLLEGKIDFLIFVSPNAVFFVQSLLQLACVPILAVGPGTERALIQAGLTVKSRPDKEFSVEGLLKLPELQSILNKRIVIFSGEKSNPLLAETLIHRGAEVVKLEVYRRECPSVKIEPLLKAWQSKIHVVVSTSCESLKNLHKIAGEAGQSWLRKIPLLVISSSMQRMALELKIGNPILEAENASDEAIVKELENWSEHARRSEP